MAAGQSLLDPSATTKLMARLRNDQQKEEPDALPGLTVRERETLALIGEGLTNGQIGQRRYLAEKTVKNHISRLLAKLGVERRIQAAVIAPQAQDRLAKGTEPFVLREADWAERPSCRPRAAHARHAFQPHAGNRARTPLGIDGEDYGWRA